MWCFPNMYIYVYICTKRVINFDTLPLNLYIIYFVRDLCLFFSVWWCWLMCDVLESNHGQHSQRHKVGGKSLVLADGLHCLWLLASFSSFYKDIHTYSYIHILFGLRQSRVSWLRKGCTLSEHTSAWSSRQASINQREEIDAAYRQVLNINFHKNPLWRICQDGCDG